MELSAGLIAITNDGAPHGVEMEPMAAIPGADDGELIARMRSGDEAAFTEIYRRHNLMIYRLALQISGSRALARSWTTTLTWSIRFSIKITIRFAGQVDRVNAAL